MTVGLDGERIGKTGAIAVGCNSILFDITRTSVLLVQRADNKRWALPGGFLEAGESVIEACEREAREETGLVIKVKRLVGVYCNPHHVTEYPNGRRYFFVTLSFEVELIEKLENFRTPEVLEIGYFTRDELKQIRVVEAQRSQIDDAFSNQAAPFVK